MTNVRFRGISRVVWFSVQHNHIGALARVQSSVGPCLLADENYVKSFTACRYSVKDTGFRFRKRILKTPFSSAPCGGPQCYGLNTVYSATYVFKVLYMTKGMFQCNRLYHNCKRFKFFGTDANAFATTSLGRMSEKKTNPGSTKLSL